MKNRLPRLGIFPSLADPKSDPPDWEKFPLQFHFGNIFSILCFYVKKHVEADTWHRHGIIFFYFFVQPAISMSWQHHHPLPWPTMKMMDIHHRALLPMALMTLFLTLNLNWVVTFYSASQLELLEKAESTAAFPPVVS